MLTKALAYAPPSAILRATLSLVLLLGFYLLILSVAAALFVTPVALILKVRSFGLRSLVFLVICWVPAGILLLSAFSTRRPEFVPPGRRLAPAEAPALFAMVEELATRAGTAPPTEVYLDWLPNLGVTEVGGIFRARRVLIVGAPLLCFLSVDELRAGIAHELGHFIGGDTRLTAFSTQTHALFASVLTTAERDPFRVGSQHLAIETGFALANAIGHVLVRSYGWVFLRLTLPLSRRQELAADALSAALVDARVAACALEKVSISGPLYHKYLQDEVGFAMRQGAMPTDLANGFVRLREQLLSTEAGRGFVDFIRSQPTETYDTHPALVDRLRALEGQPSGSTGHDVRPAVELFADALAFDAWLVEATRERMIVAVLASDLAVRSLQDLPWAQIPDQIYTPRALEAARRAAERLHPLVPTATTLAAMFIGVWRQLEAGASVELALRLEPALERLEPRALQRRSAELCINVLGTLLQGALIERGAVAEASFGESSMIFRLEGERINAAKAALLLTTDRDAARAVLERWAERLAAA